ncbi:MAG: DNA polymerase III subunit beta [Syntrophomonas sp.]|uniref:DNA polymerase III subunit beta n=1 Tax=Syntrophomonas sp. TaxID=2053627 RepID=UPI002602F6E4|nr:DNA polymerase III subunit beta [Syntrophomonas sp.]MDD2510006.1 DNA polymerase III subunit beta [Syntrophomonas sp.]MDD3878968.1 DNA polymerase III subunit beta [Syntrophomonas sp.]MDD4626117.1 DNA polymerase III subunit beta [Syntrophomonas sp.]
MKLTIEKRDLLAITSLVYRAASSKNAIPVLSGLLLETDPDTGLTMTATDMEIGVKASTAKSEVIEKGSVLVNAHYFFDFVKLLPEAQIFIGLNQETSRLDINYGRSTGFINTYRDYEYPELPLKKIKPCFSISQEILKDALKKTVFAAANTHFRQVFTGVLFDLKEGGQLNIVASDTHRLARYFCTIQPTAPEPLSFIIPARTATEVLRLLDDSPEEINIGLSDNNVSFYRNNVLLLSRLIEGQYPNYEQVIPRSFSYKVKLDTQILADTLERARVMPSDDKLKIQYTRFKFEENEVEVNTFSEIMGEIAEVIEISNASEGEGGLNIAFNTNYFLDVVKILDGEARELVINLSSLLGPAMIENPQKDNYLYVLVPLRTSN